MFFILGIFIFSLPYFSRKENSRCFDCHINYEILKEKGKTYQRFFGFKNVKNLLFLSSDLDFEKRFPVSASFYFDSRKSYYLDLFIAGQASFNRKIFVLLSTRKETIIREFFFSYERFKLKFFTGFTTPFFESPLKYFMQDSIYSYFYLSSYFVPSKNFILGILKYFYFKQITLKPYFSFSYDFTPDNYPVFSSIGFSLWYKFVATELFFEFGKQKLDKTIFLIEIIKLPFVFNSGFFFNNNLKEYYFISKFGFLKLYKNPFSLLIFVNFEKRTFSNFLGTEMHFFIQENIKLGLEYKFVRDIDFSMENFLKFFIEIGI